MNIFSNQPPNKTVQFDPEALQELDPRGRRQKPPPPPTKEQKLRELSRGLVQTDPSRPAKYVFSKRPESRLTKKEIDDALPLVGEYERVYALLLEHVEKNAKKSFLQQNAELIRMAASGDDAGVRSMDVWSKSELATELANKRAAFKQVMREISAKARTILRPCAERQHQAAIELVDELKSKEEIFASELGAGFVPSGALSALAWLAVQGPAFSIGVNGYSDTPRIMLEKLGHVFNQ